PNLQLP
ncbi:bacterial lipid A biosynthesis acyltransferase family protein, partial [Chlamydia psittaci 02DC14]